MTVRKEITLAGVAGQSHEVLISGYEILVEKSPDNTPAGVPEIVVNTPGMPEFPAYNQARFRPPDGFERFYVKDKGGAAGVIYLTVVIDSRLQFRLSSTVE